MKIHSKRTNVYSAMIPLYVVSKLLGLAPIRLKTAAVSPENLKGSSGLLWTVANTFYSITILLIFVTLYCVSLRLKIENIYSTLKYTYVLTDGFNSALMLATVFISIIQAITFNRNKLDKILSKINNIDRYILRNSMCDLYKNTRTLLVFHMTVIAVGFIFVCVYEFISDFRRNIIILMTHNVSHIIRIIMDTQFLSFNVVLKYRFDVLNKKLLSFFGIQSERELEKNLLDDTCKASTNEFKKVRELNRTRLQRRLVKFCNMYCDLHGKLVMKGPTRTETVYFRNADSEPETGLQVFRISHNELCNIARLVVSTYGVYIVFELLSICADVITVLYFTTDNVISEGYVRIGDVGWCLVWLILHATKLIGITRTCEMVSNSGNHTSVLVSKLMLLSQHYSSKTITQLEMFCHQLRSTKLKFSACDFFELNNTTLGSVAKLAVTYVTVLLLNQTV
jgi:hypothetical protein